MSKEIQETEAIQILESEEDQRGYALKATFDGETFRKIAFMVRNHAEIKRGKARMVINYKELNKNCLFDGYFIPNKNNPINLAKGKTYFSKFGK